MFRKLRSKAECGGHDNESETADLWEGDISHWRLFNSSKHLPNTESCAQAKITNVKKFNQNKTYMKINGK